MKIHNPMLFSVIIATKDRKDDLVECLRSLRNQSLLPQQIVIVDASKTLARNEADRYQDAAGSIPVMYVKAKQAGLPSQRNQGMSLLDARVEYVMFLDDDVVLEPDCCLEAIRLLESNASIVGIESAITNQEQPPGGKWGRWFDRLFLIDSKKTGQLLPSGFNAPRSIQQIRRPSQVEWLQGCSMSYRRSLIQGLQFDPIYERFAGYAYGEDLDFSYAASKRGQLWFNPNARMLHKRSPSGRLSEYRFGISQVTNRALFVLKHWGDLYHFVCFLWAMVGIVLANVAMMTRGRSRKRVLGNIVGLVLVLTGQVRPHALP